MIHFVQLLLVVSFCSISFFSNGQRDYMVPQGEIRDAFGRPLTTKNESGVEGSPYVYDIYVPGRMIIKGRLYSNLNIKLNLETNTIFFEKDGIEMIPSSPVNAVELFDVTINSYHKFRNGFPAINKNTGYTFYQVLDSGKAVLLKHIHMIPRESRQYGEAIKIKRYEQVKSYYIFKDNNIIQIKKADAIKDALKENKSEIETFISLNKIKVNREADLKSLIAYYNTL